MSELGTRKGFYFQRLDDGGVRLRVLVDGPAEVGVIEPVKRFREVELTAAEWVDVVLAVSSWAPELHRDEVRDSAMNVVVEMHMGAAEGL